MSVVHLLGVLVPSLLFQINLSQIIHRAEDAMYQKSFVTESFFFVFMFIRLIRVFVNVCALLNLLSV